MDTDGPEEESMSPELKFPFGKYKGQKVETIRLCDPQYIVWLHDKATLSGEIKTVVEAIYDECVDAANKKISPGQPQRRKSMTPSINFSKEMGLPGEVDFMGNYSDDEGAEIPNFGYMTNEEMSDSGGME